VLSAYIYFDKITKITKNDVYVSKYGDLGLNLGICGSCVVLYIHIFKNHENRRLCVEIWRFGPENGHLWVMCDFCIYIL